MHAVQTLRRSALAVALTATLAAAQTVAQPPGSTRPGRRVAFQPGVQIDWSVPQVEVQAQVVLTDGLLELFDAIEEKS